MKKEKVEVLIIGAGPAGTVAASYLAENGVSVKIVEKAKFPRYSIGESLIPHCMDNFEEAGLLSALKEKKFHVKKGAAFAKNDQEVIFDFDEKFGEGWSWTWQVSRDDFDSTLAKTCQKKGVEIAFETEVTAVDFSSEKPLVDVETASKEVYAIQSNYVIDASGAARILAKHFKLEAPPRVENHSSLFTQIKNKEFALSEKPYSFFTVLEQQVWNWIIPLANGKTSIGFVAPQGYFDFSSSNSNTTKLMNDLLVKNNLSERLAADDFVFSPKLFKNIAKNTTELYGKNFAIAGNSAEFLDPIFSSGVAFATESGLLAAKLFLKETHGENVDWQTEYSDHLRQGTEVFSTYVKEWYSGNLQKLIFHPHPNEEIKQQICAVLAGYVWNRDNPFVCKHDSLVKNLAHLIGS